MVLVSGEAGVGKSRLLAEIQRRAGKQDFLVLQGHCFEQDISFPYAPLVDLLRTFVMRHPVAETFDLLGPLTGELVKLLPELTQTLNLAPSPALEPEAEKRRLFEALARLFIQLSVSQPLLIILEDIHWSDETSLDFLHVFARRLSDYPILLLASYRREEVSAPLQHLLAQFDRERLAHEVVLESLARSEVDTMLQAIFALERPVRSEFLDAVHDLSEGNPFFIEEILRSLIASGEVFYTSAGWERKPLEELHIPRSVRDAVGRRFNGLSAAAREVVTLAAVAGRRFDFALLQRLTGHGEDELLGCIKALIAAQMVVEESAERFAFRHELTRQAVYATLLARERKALHRAIAEALEALDAGRDTHLGELAHHCYQAHAWDKALVYAARAGERALSLHAPRAAAQHFTWALEAARQLQRGPSSRLYRLRGLASETLGDFESARADLDAALELAQAAADREAEWQLLIDLGKLWGSRDYARTGSYFQRALDIARGMDEPSTLARSLNRMGNWHVNIEEPERSLPLHQEALVMLRKLGDAHGLAEALELLGVASILNGDLIGSMRYYEEAKAIFEDLADRRGLALAFTRAPMMALNCLTDTVVPAATLSEAVWDGERALGIIREIGWRSEEVCALALLACCLGSRGELARALVLAQEGLALATELNHRQWQTLSHAVLGGLYFELLALPEAQRHLEAALVLAREIGSIYWIRVTTGLLSSVYVARADYAEAQALLNIPGLAMQTLGQRLLWCARAELALAQGEPHLALQLVERLLASAVNVSSVHAIPRLAKLRGEALAALSRLEEAEESFLAAGKGVLEQGAQAMLWRIQLPLGKLYLRQKRFKEAEQQFSAARALLGELATQLPDDLGSKFLNRAQAMLPSVPRSRLDRR